MRSRRDDSNIGIHSRLMAWTVIRWILAIGLVTGWVLMLEVPGTLPWIFVAAAGIAVGVLVSTMVLFAGAPSANAPRRGR